MSNPSAYQLTPVVQQALKDLGYVQMSISTWRADAEDVMIFVSIMPTDKQICGHMTRKNMNSPNDKPYSPVWATPFEGNVGDAIQVCARHMLNVAEEHTLTGAISFQRYGMAPGERIQVLTASCGG